ncbi:MAG TPA: twin-arginine translocase subunit TatC [Limnochordia bacterium]
MSAAAGERDQLAGLVAMTWLEHLTELRARVLVALAALGCGTVAGWFAVEDVLVRFGRIAAAAGGRLVFVTPAEAFFSELRIAAALGCLFASPVLIWEGWRFVAPALFPHERRLGRVLLPVSAGLAALGLAFGYGLVYPISARTLMTVAGPQLEPILSVGRLLSYLLTTTLPFALIFQMPLVLLALAALGIVEASRLREMRRPAYILAFVAAGVVSPNVAAQALMAIPMVLLYELSIPLVAWSAPRLVRQRGETGGAGGDPR